VKIRPQSARVGRNRINELLLLGCCILYCAPLDGHAAEQSARSDPRTTVVQKLPCTIRYAGTYVLTRDLTVSGNDGIVVAADDVTIDLGGHSVSFKGAKQGNTSGIWVHNCRHTRIANGAIRNFTVGVYLDASGNHGQTAQNEENHVEGVKIQSSRYAGIKVDFGSHCLIEGCVITNLRGSAIGDVCCGILMSNGESNRILSNRISHIVSKSVSVACGIYSTDKHSVLQANKIGHCSYGIYLPRDSNSKLAGNAFEAVTHKIQLW
jgi:nitrous oxidase accessory protein NosD